MRGQSRNDQGAETASTWPVFRCSLPMALSCRVVARGALPRRDDPASCRPGSSWSTGQGRKPRRCQGSWPGSRRALRKLIVHGTAWFNLGCARWRPCLSLSHRDDARCQFRRQSGVMRGTVPHSHEVIQPTERKPPNPDGRARVRAAPGERPAQLREGGRCDDRWPACAQRTVVLRGGPATPGQEYLAMTAALRESAVTEARRSLEVRWIFPGPLEAAAARWFGRYPARTESREDTYLLDPRVARAIGKSPRGRGIGGEGVPRQSGNTGGGGPRPRPHGVLAEVVLSLQAARPGPR